MFFINVECVPNSSIVVCECTAKVEDQLSTNTTFMRLCTPSHINKQGILDTLINISFAKSIILTEHNKYEYFIYRCHRVNILQEINPVLRKVRFDAREYTNVCEPL